MAAGSLAMTPVEWAVTIVGAALIVAVNFYFFAPPRSARRRATADAKQAGVPSGR